MDYNESYSFPNQNNISHPRHNNYNLTNKFKKIFVEDLKTTKFKPVFLNNSFPEIMNFYEDLVLTSTWDVRENGDYETVILGRSNMFYNVQNTKWSLDFNLNQNLKDLERTKENRLTPLEVFNDIYNSSQNENIFSSSFKIDTDSLNENIEDVEVNLEKNLFRKESRRISENHFAVSKINLISHDIKVNKDIANCVTVQYEIDDEEDRLGLSIVYSPRKDDYVQKPIKDLKELMNEKLKENNILVQIDYMSTQLIKELEMVYQGKIFILFNEDIEIGDTITLIDETTSTHGVFKILSFEHTLDERGLITVLTVCASFEIRDPALDGFSTKISYQLLNDFKKNFNIESIDDSNSFVIDRIYATYLKFLTQSPKYLHFSFAVFNEDEVDIEKDTPEELFYLPTIMPIRFLPMFKKGQAQIPEALEKGFIQHHEAYKNWFSVIKNFFSFNLRVFLSKNARKLDKLMNWIGDFFFGLVTFNLHETLKPLLGITRKYSKEALIGEFQVFEDEFSKNEYSPFSSRTPLGVDLDFSVAFFNVRLQTTKDLNNGRDIVDEIAIKKVKEKEKVIKNLVTSIFDYTFMVEIYDAFKIKNEEYNYKNFIENVTPVNGESQITLNPLFTNKHGSEYGAIIKNNKVDTIHNFLLISNKKSSMPEENSRHFVKSTIELPQIGINMNKINIYWFHNLYGATNLKNDTIKARQTFITEVLNQMKKDMKENPNDGYVLMGDCNLKIYNYNNEENKISEDGFYYSSADSSNYIYRLNEEQSKDFKSLINTGTTLKKDNTVNNSFDNIVVSRNLLKVKGFTYGTYEYNFADKLLISDHIPIYIGFKKTN